MSCSIDAVLQMEIQSLYAREILLDNYQITTVKLFHRGPAVVSVYQHVVQDELPLRPSRDCTHLPVCPFQLQFYFLIIFITSKYIPMLLK